VVNSFPLADCGVVDLQQVCYTDRYLFSYVIQHPDFTTINLDAKWHMTYITSENTGRERSRN
jgi:hypothetical protein